MKSYSKIFFAICVALLFSSCEEAVKFPENERIGIVKISEAVDNIVKVKSTTSTKLNYAITPHLNRTATEYNKFSYASSEHDVFTVDEHGEITAFKNGRAQLIVTVSADDKDLPPIKGSCVIEVIDQVFVKEIILDASAKEIKFDAQTGFMSFDLAGKFTVSPENALIKDVTFESTDPLIVDVDENGLIKALAGGKADVKIIATDRSGTEAICTITVFAPIKTFYSDKRANWTVETSHVPSFGGVQYLFDGVTETTSNTSNNYLGMGKPGRSPGVNPGDEVFFIVDFKEKLKFNTLIIYQRTINTIAALRVWEFDIYGSDDGVEFTKVQEAIPMPNYNIGSHLKAEVDLNTTVEYQYFKFIYKKWNTGSGSSMFIQELEIGYDEVLEISSL